MSAARGQRLSDARKLLAWAVSGRASYLPVHDGQLPVVRASELRDLCLGETGTDASDYMPVTGVRVRGRLQLAGAHLTRALRFRDCVFEDPVDLRWARAEAPIEWEGGCLAGLVADRFESAADLAVRGAAVTGPVTLHWAYVQGDVAFTGSQFRQGGSCAIDGSDLRADRTLFLDGEDFHAEGEVRLRSAHIKGDLNCRHARFDNPHGHCINAARLLLEGELQCEDGFRADGEVCLQWAQVHRVRATAGTFGSRSEFALHGDAMRVEAGVYLDRGFEATATVRLIGANITGELCCTEGVFSNQNAHALDAERIVADDVYLDKSFSATGQVRFTDAEVKRQFNATNGAFCHEGSDGYALNLDGLNCGGQVYLNEGFQAAGAVSLRGASIGGELNCTSGSFTNPEGLALFADGMTTPGVVYLDRNFRARGQVRLARATVGRQLVCTGGTFARQHGTALDLTGLVSHGDVLLNGGSNGNGAFHATGEVLLRGAVITRDVDFTQASLHGDEGVDARSMQVGGRLIWKTDHPPEGRVDLSLATVSRLDDQLGSWPDHRYTLDDLTYRVTDGNPTPITVEQRIGWLDRTRDYAPSAYYRLADSYRMRGKEADAEKALIACHRHLRTRGVRRKRTFWWNLFLEYFVGYGYRLYRAFVFLLILGLIGGFIYLAAEHANLIFSTQSVPGNKKAVQASGVCVNGYPCFNPWVYSYQLLVPGLDLREATYWLPTASTAVGKLLMAYTWAMIVIGWVAATGIAAGISRIFRQR